MMVKLWNMLQQLPTLFDGIALPEGLDHDSMVNSILFEAAELPPVYTDPALLKQMIAHYFSTRLAIHSQLVSVLSVEYDPIENYNRYEDRTTSGTNAVTKTDSENISTTENGTTSGTVTSSTSGSTSGEVENKVSAYNADTYQPDDHTDSSTTSDTQTETETGGTSSNTGTSQKTGSGTENGTTSGHETSHIHGNIGVTTSQQMIESSIDLLGVSDVYRYITADFIKTFCIRCY